MHAHVLFGHYWGKMSNLIFRYIFYCSNIDKENIHSLLHSQIVQCIHSHDWWGSEPPSTTWLVRENILQEEIHMTDSDTLGKVKNTLTQAPFTLYPTNHISSPWHITLVLNNDRRWQWEIPKRSTMMELPSRSENPISTQGRKGAWKFNRPKKFMRTFGFRRLHT